MRGDGLVETDARLAITGITDAVAPGSGRLSGLDA